MGRAVFVLVYVVVMDLSCCEFPSDLKWMGVLSGSLDAISLRDISFDNGNTEEVHSEFIRRLANVCSPSLALIDIRGTKSSLESLCVFVSCMGSGRRKPLRIMLGKPAVLREKANLFSLLSRIPQAVEVGMTPKEDSESVAWIKGKKPDFQDVAEKVKRGEEVTENVRKDIDDSPDKSLVPSVSTMAKPKKPWEK